MEQTVIQMMQQRAVSDLTNKINKELENKFIEGLKAKGHSFSDRSEIHQFVEKHCRCEDDTMIQIKTYFVNDEPFMKHDYSIKIVGPLYNDNVVTFQAQGGRVALIKGSWL